MIIKRWRGQVPDDGDGKDDHVMARRSLVVGAALYGLLGLIWGSIYLALGLTIPAMIPYSYVGFAVVVLMFYRLTGWFEASRTAILLAWLFLPLILQVTLGGFDSGSAVVLWSLAAPIGSLFVAPRESVLWAGGFIAVLLIAWVAEPQLVAAEGLTPGVIRAFFALNLTGVGAAVVLIVRDFLRRLQAARGELEAEKARSDALLLNVLPGSIAERLKSGEETIADRHDEVTILFADIVGFTTMTGGRTAEEIVDLLDGLVAKFDRLVDAHQLEKIRTAGDGYMAVAGAPEPSGDHVARAANLALDMLEIAHNHTEASGKHLEVRIGLDCGPVIAGVIGLKKFTYDVWGDPVNTASRMESHGVPGKIQVTEMVHDRLQDSHQFEERGLIDVKGKGEMRTFFLVGREPAPRSDEVLREPL
ncbi:MAG: adenylate/guanylate cyclase domain-containing protein [Actinomycetota bacterium]